MTIPEPQRSILLCTQGNLALRQTLNDGGYRVLLASNNDEIQARIAMPCIQLAIVDDVAICRELRQVLKVPILVLCHGEDVEAALEAGATDCLIHPVHHALLQRRVECLLAGEASQHADDLEQRVQERTTALSKANRALREEILRRQEIEDQLMQERTLLQTLINHIPDAITVKDVEGRILVINRAAVEVVESIVGIQSQDEILHKKIFDLHHDKAEAQRLYQREMAVIQAGQLLVNFEELYATASGQQRWMLVTKVPFRNAQGEIIGLVNINRDVTQLKQAELKLQEEGNLLRALLDTIPDSIYVKDSEHRFVMVNQAVLKRRQVNSVEEIQGKTDLDFNPPEYAEMTVQQERTILDTGTPLINMPHTTIDTDGNLHHLIITKLPLRDTEGHITGLVGINRDITNLIEAEARLEQVLTGARCLLWSATVEYNLETDSYSWNTRIENVRAAQTLLPLDTIGRSYVDAWQASILPDDQQRREFIFKAHATFHKEDYSLGFRCRLKDGRVRWLAEDVRLHSLGNNRWYLVGICTDISERKHVEAQLQHYNEVLEEHVQQRTAEFVKANDTLRQEIAERQRAETAEREQRILAEALRDSVAAINKTLDRDTVLDTLLDAMLTVAPHDAASIMLLQPDGKARIVRIKGYDESVNGRIFDISDWKNYQWIFQTEEPSITNDTNLSPTWHKVEASDWVRSNIAVPIMLEGEIIGFLNLDSATPNTFTQHHAQWLFSFAHQAGTAIRNARMVREIREYAQTMEQQVTERTAELENERAQLHAILNAMRDGVMYQVKGLLNPPEYTNRALVDLTGYSQNEWSDGSAQQNVNILSAEARHNIFQHVEKVLGSRGYTEGETTLRRKDGTTFDASLVRTEARNSEGEQLGIVTVIRDISQAKQLEEQKNRFIASASHELRTPIANMKTRLFLMKRRPERFMEHVGVAESVVNLMQQLVEDMFDVSRFERGIIVLDYEDVVLQNLIHEVLQFLEPEAERQQIELRIAFPPTPLHIEVDPYRLTQVIINLLKNALNYTPPEGVVQIGLRLEHDEVVIQVADTGTGIADHMLPHLFEPFFRVSEDNKGAGLGLSIAQEIVKSHSGAITVDSVVGEGSRFTVRLPQHQTQPQMQA